MRFSGQLLEMGAEIDAKVDPAEGEVLVVLKMKVEDARKLSPLLYKTVGLEVLPQTVPEDPSKG